MTIDPALAYAGPESRSIDVTVILYGGAAIISRGVIGNFETSVGEASAPFADAGPLAWIAFDGDPSQIEFVQYTEPATSQILHRRVTRGERTSANYDTTKLHLSLDATTMPAQRPDFDRRDFDPRSFATD